MIIRVRGAKGACRVEVEPGEPASRLFEQTSVKLKMGSTPFGLARDPKGKDQISVNASSIALAGLNHGDMIYLVVDLSATAAVPDDSASSFLVAQVDRALDRKDGLVHRKPDPRMCSCTAMSSCINCMPLEPYDETVLNMRDPPIKKLSFHSYLRKIGASNATGRSTSVINLQEAMCSVNKDCDACPGWPKGICSACQPSAMRLKQQEYRHVDYVSFESNEIVGRMIGAWISSGTQRIGYLYGKYEEYDQVPLGIQAVVAAIYEPPQSSEPDGVELLDDPNAETVDRLYAQIGLEKVGWIFTDLEVEPGLQPPNNTKYKRFVTKDNSMLTGYEVIYAAMQQVEHPNVVDSKYSSSGVFGSKYITCVISGGEDNEIGFKAYQATNNAMALARAEALAPSAVKRDEVCVRESNKDHYVPEVLYQHKNEFGVEVTSKADPGIPLDYLFVTLESGFKTDSSSATFAQNFVIGNRAQLGEIQDLPAVQRHFAQPGGLLNRISDFHLLTYLATNDVVPFVDEMPTILSAVKAKDASALEQWAAHSEKWQTLQMLMQFSSE